MKARTEVPSEDRWNVEALFANDEAWEQAYQKISREGQHPKWPELNSFRGRLKEGPETIKQLLDLMMGLDRILSKLSTYAHLRHDEDIAEDHYKAMYSRITNLYHEFNQEISWFDPELLALPESTINELLSSSLLADYRFHIERIVRLKHHTLTEESEEVLALSGQATQSSYKAFCAISDADFKFGNGERPAWQR